MRAVSLEQLCRATRVQPNLLRALLEDERRRGHVEVADGRYRATPVLLRSYGDALRGIHR